MISVDATLNTLDLSDVVPQAVIVSVRRGLVGKRRHSSIDIPGRAGSWTFDEQPGDRAVELEIDLQGVSFEDRREAVRELAYWADVGTTSRLILSDEPDRFHDALLDDAPNPEEWLLRGGCSLRFLVGPYALMLAVSTEAITANSNPDSGSFAVADRVTAEPVIEITPAGGGLTGFTLTVNGYGLTWAGVLGSGATLTISSISDTVTVGANDDVDLTGTFDVADLDMADVSGEFPLILEGTNTWAITWTGAATSVAVDFTWRERTR